MNDSIKPHLTEAQFLASTGDVEPFRFILSGKKGTIVFPDYNAGTVEEARAMEHKLQHAIDPYDGLEKWLSTEDFEKLRSVGLNARKINSLYSMAYQYTNGEKRARKSIKQSDLDAECADPSPFTFVLSSGKRVIFPDFASGDYDEIRDFYQVLQMNQRAPEVFLRKWIGEQSWKNLQTLNLNARQLSELAESAIDHYIASRGTPGESIAS